MKKLAYIMAAGLAFSSFQPFAYAHAANNQQEETIDLEKVSVLSIDDAVSRGIEQSSMLLLLEYQLESMDNQQKDMVWDIDNLNEDLDDAESNRGSSKLSDIKERLTNLNVEIGAIDQEITAIMAELEQNGKSDVNETLIFLEKQNELLQKQFERFTKSGEVQTLVQSQTAILQALAAVDAQIEALEDAIDQMELALKKFKAGELQLSFEAEEAELIVEMMLKSSYIGLLSTLEQIDLMQVAYEQAEKDHNALKLKVELGLGSTYELKKSERELASQKQEIEKAKQNYQMDLAKLALDIGVEYHSDIKLQEVDVATIGKAITKEQMNQLVKDSYSYKKAEQNLAIAEMDLADLKEKIAKDDDDDDKDISEYQLKQAEIAIDIEKEKIRQLKLDAKESIETMYYELEKANQNREDKKRDLNYAKEDYKHLEKQYEFGVLSKNQVQQGEMLVKQAEFDYEMAEISLFMINEQIKAIHKGLIQTQ